jgi:hypothetical protein
MATLPVITGAMRVTLNWTDDLGGTAANVIHVDDGGHNTTTVFNSLAAHVVQDLWSYTSNHLRVTSVAITPLDGHSATNTFGTGSVTGWTGSTTGDPIPQMASIVSIRTALRGRSHRGRIFLPGVSEAQQSNGTLNSSGIASWQAAWTTFLAALTSDGNPMALASYKLASLFPITGVNCEGKAGTIRGRMTRLR